MSSRAKGPQNKSPPWRLGLHCLRFINLNTTLRYVTLTLLFRRRIVRTARVAWKAGAAGSRRRRRVVYATAVLYIRHRRVVYATDDHSTKPSGYSPGRPDAFYYSHERDNNGRRS